MVRIPNIKIPSVRVGSIYPTSNIGTGGATPAPPTPITYLTQWEIVGNSEVHTDEYLTSWKVSGNSVIDNNTILSCGDLGQDGKYHVKISNGVTIYDIALTEPLRKVNDVADTIEFPSGTDGKALVTRMLKSVDMGDCEWTSMLNNDQTTYRYRTSSVTDMDCPSNVTKGILLSAKYQTRDIGSLAIPSEGIGCYLNSGEQRLYCYDSIAGTVNDSVAFREHVKGIEVIYKLITPTTELVDAPQIAVSPTDIYTSANVTPYSAFEHTEHKEIWSCGEYNATDGKYHILVQPLGGSIADIALDEPLRKINDVADSIEFSDGVATLTRKLASVDKGTLNYTPNPGIKEGVFSTLLYNCKYTYGLTADGEQEATVTSGTEVKNIQDKDWCFLVRTSTSTCLFITYYAECAGYNASEFAEAMSGKEFIYELATPTTNLVDAPQIQEAESYTCVISQGGKAVSWSSFETDSE